MNLPTDRSDDRLIEYLERRDIERYNSFWRGVNIVGIIAVIMFTLWMVARVAAQ